MTFSGLAEDRLKIRERLDKYSDAVFRRDLDDYLACWTEDCVRSGPGGDCRGKDALRAQWTDIWHTLERMAFFTQVASIAVDGDRATARSYCLEILALRNGDSRRLIGMYDDELVRIGEEWLFSRRNYQVLIDNV